MAPRWPEMGPRGPFLGPDTDRGEVGERLGEQVWPTMAPGAPRARLTIFEINTHTPIHTGSEHALGRRPGEFTNINKLHVSKNKLLTSILISSISSLHLTTTTTISTHMCIYDILYFVDVDMIRYQHLCLLCMYLSLFMLTYMSSNPIKGFHIQLVSLLNRSFTTTRTKHISACLRACVRVCVRACVRA